eukprot:scaffold3825_cov179-Ochromonas_danica.AAC.3
MFSSSSFCLRDTEAADAEAEAETEAEVGETVAADILTERPLTPIPSRYARPSQVSSKVALF